MKFLCRTVKPRLGRWHEIEAETAEDAAQTYHVEGAELCPPPSGYVHQAPGSENRAGRVTEFLLVEVQDHGEVISRAFLEGMRRRGGITPKGHKEWSIEEIAAELGWDKEPELLLATGWEGEEP
jgi:hypothetical protein